MKEFDLNLIAIFEALYEERNQSRAAERLGISQPAVSHALTRLRTSLNDQLFHDRAMNPTATANDLYSQFHLGLNQIRAGFQDIEQFKPGCSHRHFSIAASYSGGVIHGPELFNQVRAVAPNVRLSLRTIDPASLIPDLLRQKNIDLAMYHVQGHDTSLCYDKLAEHHVVLVARKGHPKLSGNFSLEDLWSLDFAAVHDEQLHYDLPSHELLRQIRQERVVLEVPAAMQLMPALAITDLVSITIKNMANFAVRNFGLEMYDLPSEIEPIPTYLVWHRGMELDAANQWLRRQIKAVWSTE